MSVDENYGIQNIVQIDFLSTLAGSPVDLVKVPKDEEEGVMACIIYDSLGDAMRGGPYPHKAGEFCGNVLLKHVAVLGDGTAVIMSPAVLSPPNLLRSFENVKLRIGKPAEINGRAENQKFVTGLYLVEDLPLPEDAVEIDTDMFSEEVVVGERLPQKPVDVSKIRRKELCF